jgi:hypothetical protein
VTIPPEPWVPLDPVEVRQVMTGYGRPWWIAGGWALDMFLGRRTRDHADVDVGVLRSDQQAVQAQLRGWELYLASDGVLSPWVAGAEVPADTCDIWCRPDGSPSWALQFMLNPGNDDRWDCRRSPMVTMPMSRAVRRTGDGLPYLAPECQLLMKAKGLRPKDEADFDVVLPALDDEQRTWLRNALERVHPGHAWSERLV